MERTRTILLFFAALIYNAVYGAVPAVKHGNPNYVKPVRTGHLGGPVRMQAIRPGVQFLNHADWNFVENKGQIAGKPDIKYYGHSGGVYLYCKPGMISFVFTKVEKEPEQTSEATNQPSGFPLFEKGAGGFLGRDAMHRVSTPSTITTSRSDLILLHSNPNAQIIASDQQEYYENFYTGGNADSGITNVHTYKTITYQNIYPHIDMVLLTKPNGMKYEFVVYPGGKISDIKMQWNGLQDMEMTKNGGIEYACSLGQMEEGKPFSYQSPVGATLAIAQSRVQSSFIKHGTQIGFKVGGYDKSKVLVIDPTLIWGTYFGGSGEDFGLAVCTDIYGDSYIAGQSTSLNYIASAGSYKTFLTGSTDAFLTKFNNSGGLIWSTYYGGSNDEQPGGLSLDAANNIYMTGGTASKNGIATSGVYQTSHGGDNYDFVAFLSKFSDSGYLIWGTYFGDKSIGYGDFVDFAGNTYITGNIGSPGYSTAGVYQSSYGGGTNDAFLAKFNNLGKLLWATYFGGDDTDYGHDVIGDGIGNVYITGQTSSKNKISTFGSYQSFIAGNDDAFLAKFDISGNLSWATYYGGNGPDFGYGLNIDSNGDIYMGGMTGSTNQIATSGTYQTIYGGNTDAFLAKFTTSGSLIWGTYYGGSGFEFSWKPGIDDSGDIYIAGSTSSQSNIATKDGYQLFKAGNNDAFLAKFDKTGNLIWSSYYGGEGDEQSNGLGVDKYGNAYIVGYTLSIKGIATTNGYQIQNRGTYDAFIAKFGNVVYSDIGVRSINSSFSNTCIDTFPVLIQLKNFGIDTLYSASIYFSIGGKIQPPYSWTGSLKPDSTINVNLGTDSFPTGSDSLKVWTEYPNGGIDSVPSNDTATIIINVHSLPAANAGPDTTLCYDESYTMQGSGGITYTWHPAIYLSSASDPHAIAILPNTENYELIVQNSFGCIDSAPVLLKVHPKLMVKAYTLNNPVCFGYPVTLYAIGSGGDSLHYHFEWPDDGATGDSISEKMYQSGWHNVVLSDNCSPDNATDSVYVTVIPPAKADFTFGQAQKLKTNQNISFLNLSSNASSYLWTFPKGIPPDNTKDSSIAVSPVYVYTDSGNYEIELIAYGISPCPNDTAYKIIKIIDDRVTIYVPNAFTPDGNGINDLFDISGTGISSYSYNIYNRWGEHIYASPNLTDGEGKGWDGKFKGQDAMEGVYIYQLDVIDMDNRHHYLSGNITLMR